MTGDTTPQDRPGKFDELVVATIRTAVDEWRIQNDPADLHGVGMPEYIRRALADAGLLASPRWEQLTAEVERLKDVDAEAFAARFQVQSYDIELGRAARTLARLLTEAGVSPIPDRLWYLAHRVKEEFEAVVRQRDEALAALETQQALLAEVQPEDLEAESDVSPAPRIWAPGSPAPDESVTEVIGENDVTFKRTSQGEWHATPPEGNGSVFSWAQINQFLTLTEVLEGGAP